LTAPGADNILAVKQRTPGPKPPQINMSASRNQTFFTRRSVRYLTVLLAALAAYYKVLGGGFVHWDDALVTGNLALRGFSADHLLSILVPAGGSYQPVRNLVLAAVYHFFRLDPFGYLLVNLSLYLLAAALAFRVLETLEMRFGKSAGPPGLISWIGAALFALHPLHVEAAAWIQGNKDLLAAVFFLGAFLCYLEFSRRTGGAATRFYLWAYLLFLLALGSKPSAAAFPLVVLAFDIILPGQAEKGVQRKRGLPLGRLALRHLPYWIPAILLAIYFIFFTTAMHQGALTAENFLSLPKVLWTYYRLILLPVGLMHRYPNPTFTGFTDPAFLAGLIATAAVAAFLLRRGREYPLTNFGIAWFYLCWLPQSNIVPIAIRVADRYIFLSLLGACLAAAVALDGLLRRCSSKACAASLLGGIILLCGTLGVLSARRCLVWQNGETLWSDAAAKKPHISFYTKGLADVYLEEGELDRAYSIFTRAAELWPEDPGIWTNMGYIRKKQGLFPEALELYGKALAADSSNFNAHNSMGNILAQTGKDSQAMACYLKALEIKPGNYMASSNLAGLYRRTGRDAQADSLMASLEAVRLPQPVILLKRGFEFVEESMFDSARFRLERALALDRDLVVAHAKLGEILLKQDSLPEALEHFRRVLEESVPDWPLLNNMALAFNRQGHIDSACVYYRKAYELEPDSAESAVNLAVALNRLKRTKEAVELLESFLQKHPLNFPAHYNLGQWYAKKGSFNQAAEHYRLALRINPRHAPLHLFLGQIYLQYLEKPDSALAHFQASLEFDPNQPYAESIRRNVEYLLSRE